MAAVALTAVLAALWLARSWWLPYRACRNCHGTKQGRGSTRRAWNRCRWCGGSGEAIRAGAWLITRITGRQPRR